MKQIAALLAVALVLAAPASSQLKPIPRPTQTPGVTLVNCWERTDGYDGFICVEQRPLNPKAVAFTYLVRTDQGLFGARIPQRR